MQAVPVFTPASPEAQAMLDLTEVVLIICGIILAIVTGLVTWCLVRYRAKPGDPEPPQTVGNKPIEITWTVIPLLVVVALFVLTARAMNLTDPVTKNRPPDLVVIGHQWWWEARYPSGVITANEIHIPAGKRLLLEVQSADVIHDFWAPELGRKIDMVPGHPNQIWLSAAEPGVYQGECAEYCGTEHAWMRFLVIAHPPEQFQEWEKRQLQPEPTPSNPAAVRGASLFQEMTCANCHALRGTAATAQFGPDLSHLAERQTLAAGVIRNTPAELARWLKDPQSIKPGVLMPDLRLSDTQVADIVAYLEPGPVAPESGVKLP